MNGPRRRRMLRDCKNHGHTWRRATPFLPVLMMGRWRCRRCHRYCWLTAEQVQSGRRQRHTATRDPEWTQDRIRYRVTRPQDAPG